MEEKVVWVKIELGGDLRGEVVEEVDGGMNMVGVEKKRVEEERRRVEESLRVIGLGRGR